MDFSYTSEQEELARTIHDLIARKGGSQRARAFMDSDVERNDELWSLLASELGLGGLTIPESEGGLGATWVEAGIALEALGSGLVPSPLLSHLVATSLLPTANAALADGSEVAAVALGRGVTDVGGRLVGRIEHVLDGVGADLLVVVASDGEAEALYVADGLVLRESRPTLDLTRRQATLSFDRTAAHQIGDQAGVDRARDLYRVAIAMESIGAARHCLDMTVEYLKTRVQFGRVLGTFQALRHRAADCAVALEAATAAARYATWVADGNPAELAEVAPLAKALATQAFRDIAAETIQLHGGIGFTWEHDAHLYFKRATANYLLGGTPVEQRQSLKTLLLGSED